MNKKDAIAFARKLGWTEADAVRAYTELKVNFSDLQTTLDYYRHEYGIEDVTDRDIAILSLVLADFAGEVLLDRQRKQAAQKAEVTKKRNQIQRIEKEHQQQIEDVIKDAAEQESVLIKIINMIYNTLKVFGVREPWLEAMLAAYEEDNNGTNNSKAAM